LGLGCFGGALDEDELEGKEVATLVAGNGVGVDETAASGAAGVVLTRSEQ